MVITLPGASSIPAVDSGHRRMSADCGRRIVQQHWFMYGEAPSVEFVAAEMGESWPSK